MAKAFLVCQSKKFLQKEYLIPIQKDLLDLEGKAEISIKPNHDNFHSSFGQYICHHDYLLNKKGKVFDKPFNYYFEPQDFYTYYNQDTGLTLIQTKTDAALDFINKMNRTDYFEIEPVDINFQKMIPLITEVAGAWIADLKRAHLKTADFFGSHVNKSEEYIEAASEGNISNIQMKYARSTDEKEYYIAISKKGSIILYDTLPTVEDELDIVMEVYNKFICPHL